MTKGEIIVNGVRGVHSFLIRVGGMEIFRFCIPSLAHLGIKQLNVWKTIFLDGEMG
jgi:hypothetical protein